MNRMLFFSSYKEAHQSLKLPGSWQRGTIGSKESGVTSIKLTANQHSFDLISQDLKTVYYVGRGKKRSPGEPMSSQHKEDQAMFYKSLQSGNPVTVLMKLKTGVVTYLGKYKVTSIRLVPGFRDIQYYQIKLSSID